MTAADIINVSIGFFAVLTGVFMFWSLPKPEARGRADLPFLSVIIPARNESIRIPPLLQSLAEQRYRSFEVLVVDDDSSDGTPEVAESFGATVLRNKSQGKGAGKSSACWFGANEAKGEWLLFLDADTYFANADAIEKLLLFYSGQGARGILSLQPYHTVRNLYENLSAVFNIIVIVGMNVFTVRGDRLRPAGSFGPCILCNKDDYFQTGGHQKIEGALMDDIALGEAFLGENLPVRCLGGKGILSFRMYPEGMRSLVDGWCKSFALGSKSTNPLVMAMTIVWISGSFISAISFISSLASGNAGAIAVSGLLYLLYAIQTGWYARRCGNFPWFIFLFYPILFLFFTIIFMYSLFRVNVLHSVNWRGRKIDV
ncbi:glycosyltransferase [Indiicoccus explosivorum]|uniref:glycosyltransferase n=1 Tax=Indiicoccus explosivorum TaxID=1917864 RepID=UPI000B449946|nr:glycosyltransferase family 2 protein [Indiicoccus explosivorum]